MTDPLQWGWVDPDGTVHVRLPGGGDAVVGQYAAGDAAAALAFYTRKFDDVVGEVRLTAERLAQGKSTPEAADAVVERLRTALAAPPFVGDLESLGHKLDGLHALAAERRLQGQAERTRIRNEALAAREAIAVEAERLATSTQWKVTGDRLKALLEEWKALPRFDKRGEQEFWERFSAARSTFDKARRAHFAELDATRAHALEVKGEILAEAQRLATSTDWAATSRAYRDLMERWKQAPRASKDVEDKLWAQFRAAQDTFFAARNSESASKGADEARNLSAKRALLQQAEALLPVTDPAAARRSLRAILSEWDAVGHVPRGDKADLDLRLRKVEDAVSRSERQQWQRTDPAMRERAERTVAGFRASVAKLEVELAAATAAGTGNKVRSLRASLDSTQALLAAAERVLAEYSTN